MKLIKNTGADRVVDELKPALKPGAGFDLASPSLSLFAFGELHSLLAKVGQARLVLSSSAASPCALVGEASERTYRNRLSAFATARRLAEWMLAGHQVKLAPKPLPQSFIAVSNSPYSHVITGACPFVTDGLGLTPSDQFGLVQAAETEEESARLAAWFERVWTSIPDNLQDKLALATAISKIADHKAPSLVYFLMLFHLFKDLGEELDEERIVKSATGIRDSVVLEEAFQVSA